MNSGWREVALSDVCADRPGKYLSADSYEGGGPYPVFGSNSIMGSHSEHLYKGPMVVMAGQGAYAGSVRFVEGDAWVNNNAFALFADPNLIHPYYLYLLLEVRIDPRRYRAGTGQPYVKKGLLRGQRFPLPILNVQRRTVDLISSIDQAIAVAERQSEKTARALEGLTENLLLESRSDVSLGELVELRSGPSWKADDESTEPARGSVPVIKITNTRAAGDLDLTERVFVRNLPESTRRLSVGSLLMIRTNGNRDRIGNVYRVTAEAVDHAYSAFQIGVFPKNPGFSDYLYWVLRSPVVQTSITDAASGSTGLGNIALSWLRELRVPWPTEEQRVRVVRRLDSVEEVQRRALRTAQKLKTVRAVILSELLSGKRTMPDSYDRLLEEAS